MFTVFWFVKQVHRMNDRQVLNENNILPHGKKSPRSKNRIEGNKYYVRLYAQTILKRREIFMCKENSTNISLLLNKKRKAK